MFFFCGRRKFGTRAGHRFSKQYLLHCNLNRSRVRARNFKKVVNERGELARYKASYSSLTEREPEFRNAVDRYIEDFEKLLADVARNDHEGMMTQTYLTSDTGKVYTMLAHASGRFDNR